MTNAPAHTRSLRWRALLIALATLLALGVGAAGSPAASPPPGGVAIPGRLSTIVSDPAAGEAKGTAMPIRHHLTLGGTTIEIPESQARGVRPGAVTAYVTGIGATDPDSAARSLRTGTARLVGLESTGPEPRIPGTHRVTIVPVYWTTPPPDVPDPVSALNTTMGKVATYYDTATAGQIRFVTDTVLGWNKITLSREQITSCDYPAMLAKARAFAPSTPRDELHHFVVFMQSAPDCPWGGLATVGTSADGDLVSWINGQAWEASLFVHEYGHNLGLWHSGYLQCWNPTRTINVTLSTNCDQKTYQDPWDLMGAPLNMPGMIATINKERLGVLAPADNPLLTSTQRITLNPVAATSGVRGFRLRFGEVEYFAEYRTSTGLDAWTDDLSYVDPSGVTRDDPGGGLIVRRQDGRFGQWGEIDVLDFHPDADPQNYAWHPGMEPGESYTFAEHGVTLSFVSASASAAVVDVTLTADDGVDRWDGPDRYAASAAISARSFPAGVGTAFIASGEVFSDALSGAPVAAMLGAPVLLVRRDSLPATIAAELRRLQPTRIVVLGGPATVSEAVRADVGAYAVEPVVRWAGADRYAASAAISASIFDPGVERAFVGSGEVFSDALSGAPVAGLTPGPMLLTRSDRLPEPIVAELKRLRPKQIVIVGGPASVSASVQDQLASFASDRVVRWSGPDRYSASAAISKATFRPGVGSVFVASGLVFTDALSGAPVAGMNASPVLLVRTGDIPDAIASELRRLKPRRIVVLGGPATVATQVEADLAAYVTR